MGHPRYTKEEIVSRGKSIYDQQIREKVEPQHNGKFLVLDIETGEFEIDADSVAAVERATAKHPDPALYLLRVGFPTAVKLGGRFRVTHP